MRHAVSRAGRSCLVILSGTGLSPAMVPGAAGLPFGVRVFVFVLVQGLQLVQKIVEPLEAAFPELAVIFQPVAGLRERLSLNTARPALGVAPAGYQAGPLQHAQ